MPLERTIPATDETQGRVETMVLPTVLKQKMTTQSIDWQCNNVVLVHYTEKGGFIEL